MVDRNEGKRKKDQEELQRNLEQFLETKSYSHLRSYFTTSETSIPEALKLLMGCGCCRRHAHGLLMLAPNEPHCKTWDDNHCMCFCSCRSLARKLNDIASKDYSDLTLGKWIRANFQSMSKPPLLEMLRKAIFQDNMDICKMLVATQDNLALQL